MPSEEITPQQIEEALATLNERGINVVETEKQEEGTREKRESAIIQIRRARSRASLTVLSSTAVITSPLSMPALAAGLLGCGSDTSAPAAFSKPRLRRFPARPAESARRTTRG
jgi:hypothetical protein